MNNQKKSPATTRPEENKKKAEDAAPTKAHNKKKNHAASRHKENEFKDYFGTGVCPQYWRKQNKTYFWVWWRDVVVARYYKDSIVTL